MKIILNLSLIYLLLKLNSMPKAMLFEFWSQFDISFDLIFEILNTI